MVTFTNLDSIPNVIALSVPGALANNPASPALVQPAIARMFKGSVSQQGKWNIEPAAGWTVEKLGVGSYRVHHFQPTVNYSVSLGASNGYVSNMIVGSFDVQITDASGNPMDGPFTLAMSMIS